MIITILVFAYMGCSSGSQHSKINDVSTLKKETMDSLDILSDVGGVINSLTCKWTDDEKRYMNIISSLSKLSFSELEEIMRDKDPIKRSYAFSTCCLAYFDSLKPKHTIIFADTSSIPLYHYGEIEQVGMTVGIYAKYKYDQFNIQDTINITP